MGDMNYAVENLIVNKDTGEIVDNIRVGDKVSITRQSKVAFLENTISIPFKNFAKFNTAEIALLGQELSKAEFVFLISLSDYVGYYDNCVKNRRGEPMTVDDIALKIGFSRSTAFRCVESLTKKSVLCKTKTNEYQLFVCPLIFCRGNRTNKVLQTMFRNYKVRSQGGIKWGKLLKREVT